MRGEQKNFLLRRWIYLPCFAAGSQIVQYIEKSRWKVRLIFVRFMATLLAWIIPPRPSPHTQKNFVSFQVFGQQIVQDGGFINAVTRLFHR